MTFVFAPRPTAERPRTGLLLYGVNLTLIEPAIKRVVTFVDGQNLYHHVKDAFGYSYPNYDILRVSECVCTMRAWNLSQARFYTGVPDATDDQFWNGFWTAKLASMGRQGIKVFSRSLRYRNKTVDIPGHGKHTFLSGEEKGIDVRLALDVISLANQRAYDVAVIFSQDQDLSEVVDEIKIIARQQDRWIRVACAHPMSPTTQNRRGINGSEWIHIDRASYDPCIDRRDYRPKHGN
jgi:uncharacterized LabA/DUF88 family protein